MQRERKTEQIQVRVTSAQKRALQAHAERNRMSLSDWILSRALPSGRSQFEELVGVLSAARRPSSAFAELLEFLARLTASELQAAVAERPAVALTPYWENYLAATIEHAAMQKRMAPPEWTRKVQPLAEPVFGSSLRSLREHLLFNAPIAFRRRNIFIDASVGARV